MAGGTQTTYTRTDPWEPQQDYLKTGMMRTEDLYNTGAFTPKFYGQEGTMSPYAEGLNQIAPGLVGFDPQQHDAMSRAYEYGMGNRATELMGQSEASYLGDMLPYTQAAMGVGRTAGDWGG